MWWRFVAAVSLAFAFVPSLDAALGNVQVQGGVREMENAICPQDACRAVLFPWRGIYARLARSAK